MLRTRLKCNPVFTLIGVMFLVPAVLEVQTGRVTLQGRVSETVALSVSPNFTHDHDAEVVSSGNTVNTVRITLKSGDKDAPVIHVPLLVRSNTSFKLSATVEPESLIQLGITDARPTGRLVSPAAISGLKVPERVIPSDSEVSRDVVLASGPRVSLGGTLESPNNALQITVLIRLKPQSAPGQLVHLTFAAAPQAQ